MFVVFKYFALLLAAILTVQSLSAAAPVGTPLDDTMYDRAVVEYTHAHNHRPYTPVSKELDWHAIPNLDEEALELADRYGGSKVGHHFTEGGKITYFSSIIKPEDDLGKTMNSEYGPGLFSESGEPKHALVFWKHENGMFHLIRVTTLHGPVPDYDLKPLGEVLESKAGDILNPLSRFLPSARL
ncbi:uncharacterized protein UTRI_10432_B [Ustilago trichophora]|uniref:Uncharacterized protein n=1 Tax=Ustilago trichophora TaxID=86804 RepID=A0A5C3EBM2_9BASI|nr:uncharacterized protein UTRI_10432_B [Ustilago trichophora]